MELADEVWVIDTSAIIHIRRFVTSEADRKVVYEALTKMVDEGRLIFPSQVYDELNRVKNTNKKDWPHSWAKENKAKATHLEPIYDEVAQVLSDPQVNKVLDPDKDQEEADPYVLAMALKAQGVTKVGVLTQEKRSRPKKLSMSDACGLLRIVSVSIEPFLVQEGIWP